MDELAVLRLIAMAADALATGHARMAAANRAWLVFGESEVGRYGGMRHRWPPMVDRAMSCGLRGSLGTWQGDEGANLRRRQIGVFMKHLGLE